MSDHSHLDDPDKLVLAFGEALNARIADPTIEFDIYSAASVAGTLLTTIVESLPIDDKGKLMITREWLESHLCRITPDTKIASAFLESALSMPDEESNVGN